MAASSRTSYAINAGLSCGIAFAVPVAAYVATIPFSDANSVVTSCALPFAVGALAGVGLLSAVSGIANHRARFEDDYAEDRADGYGRDAGAPVMSQEDDDVRRFFGRGKVPKDVPIIARAYDALSEEDAWADIDAMLGEDSPVSCDASRSKDIYEIALEELRRENAAAQTSAAAAARAASGGAAGTGAERPASARTAVSAGAPSASPAAPAPMSTAMFLTLAQEARATHGAAAQGDRAYVPAAAASAPAPSAASAPVSGAQADARFDEEVHAAQRAALASLDTLDIEGFDSEGTASVAHRQLVQPVRSEAPAQASAAFAADPAAPRAAAQDRADRERASIWASALDILAEDAAPQPVAAQEPAPAYVGRHAARDPARIAIDSIDSDRMKAVAEGRRATQVHQHVNDLIEEELDKVASPSVRRSGREYLRVIQGGTAAMPRLQAEA